MALKPEISLGMGAAVVALDYAIYQNALPTAADIRSLPAMNNDVEVAEKHAFITALAVTSAISLIAKDATIFILGAGAAVAMSWMNRHANAVHPLTGTATGLPKGGYNPSMQQPSEPQTVLIGDGSF